MPTMQTPQPGEAPTTATTARSGRFTRRALALAPAVGLLAAAATARAQPPIISTKTGEPPTTGGMRPGPVGMAPPPSTRLIGVVPVAIHIDKAAVDASIEVLDIVDGVMQNPTGPWVVSWYRQTAKLGTHGNVVLAGHVDYWGVGPSVFYNLRDLKQGDEIDVTGDDGTVFKYAVDWNKNVDAENAPLDQLVGSTGADTLTIITCGGPFDYVNGHYLQRTVVRANRAV